MMKMAGILMLGTAVMTGAAWAEEKKAIALDYAQYPATAKLLSLCEGYILAQVEETGAAVDEAKKAEIEAFNKEYALFAETKLTPEHTSQIEKTQAIFQSYYERDLDKLKAQKKPYTADQVQKMCIKHAKGAGKTFDAEWKKALAKAEEAAPKKAEIAIIQPAEKPKVAPHAKAKVLEGLKKTLILIDQAMENKYTTDEEKVKLLAQKDRIAHDIARWEAMETTEAAPSPQAATTP